MLGWRSRKNQRYQRLFTASDFENMHPEDRAAFLRLEHEAFEMEIQNRVLLQEHEQVYKARIDQARQERKIRARELRVRSVEVYFRTALTLILVMILAIAIFVGIIKGVPAGNLTEYLTPISGLAGIAIGYFFGRGTDSKATQENPPEEVPDG